MIPLCALDELPEGTSRGFQLGALKLLVVKHQHKPFVYHNQCPHLGIPLEWEKDQFLDPSGSMIQCANHGALFVIDTGLCVAGPCSGRKLQPVPCFVNGNQLLIESKFTPT
ncbi:Rieske (2Fe-2S) protein [Cellvibrio fontiphilus]|uniref:Rieske (2Fe-2S) protein n=1 Tax=Cellvibrio fontiphilus TaxID=1815559 RepID=A0ABV7FE22_9GAMM